MLALVQFVHVTDFMLIMPLAPELIELWKINSKTFNLIVGSYAFGAVISAFLSILFLKDFKLNTAFVVSLIGFVLSTIGCAVSVGYISFLLFRFISGLFGGLLGAIILSIAGEQIPNERRARGIGIIMMGFSLAAVLGVPFGIWLSEIMNYKLPFYVLAITITLVTFLVILYIPKNNSTYPTQISLKERIKPIPDLFKTKNQYKAIFTMGLLVIGQFTMIQFISQYLIYNLGYPKDKLWLVYSIGGATGAITSPISGYLADKFGRFKVLSISSLLSCIPFVIIPFLTQAGVLTCLIATTSLFIVIGGRMIPATTMVTSAVSNKERPSFMGINVLFRQIFTLSATLFGMLLVSSDKTTHVLINFHLTAYVGVVSSLLVIPLAYGIKALDQSHN